MNIELVNLNIADVWQIFDTDIKWICPKVLDGKKPWCYHLYADGTCGPYTRNGMHFPVSGYAKDCSETFDDEISALGLEKYKDFGGSYE